jgi:hypothetical protein
MRKVLFILYFLLINLLPSCNKDSHPDTSGTVTINNILEFDNARQSWFVYGFSFSEAKLVAKLKPTSPGISIDNDGTLENLILQEYNLNNPFYKAGDYPNATAAKQAFDNMTSVQVPEWAEWADSIKANQVWIYRSGTEHYAKIRIISIVSEVRNSKDYAECTFEWVYQPDGTLTFPGK